MRTATTGGGQVSGGEPELKNTAREEGGLKIYCQLNKIKILFNLGEG